MRLLTEDAVLRCDHVAGIVGIAPRQDWVTISGRRVLIEADTLDRPIAGCPFITPTTPPCLHTVSVDEDANYPAFLTILGRGDRARRPCTDGATGRTDWGQTRSVSYRVAAPGQDFVEVGG
jgi:hypothetical protein